MIGIDTNIIIRFLLDDDSIQSKKAKDLIHSNRKSGEVFWIGHVTLCEIVWVLDRGYKLPKNELVKILTMLLQSQQIEIEDKDSAQEALKDFISSKGVGFVDCLIGRQNYSNSCEFTYTFDVKASKQLKTFKIL